MTRRPCRIFTVLRRRLPPIRHTRMGTHSFWLVRALIFAALCLGDIDRSSGQDCSSQATLLRQGVVSLEVKKVKKTTGQVIQGHAAGFIVTPQGYVLTADHIVARDASID